MPLPGERQGYLTKVENKTINELKDLLQRQENLLSKQNFLRTLPDKGIKVKQFAETLERLIHEKIAQENDQSLNPSLTNIINITSAFSTAYNGRHYYQSETNYSDVTETHEELKFLINPSALPGGDQKIIIDEREIVSDSKKSQSTESQNITDVLSESFQKVRVSDTNLTPTTKNFDNCINPFESVIRRAEQRPITKKPAFKPNSSLLVSNVEDLPDKYKLKSKHSEHDTMNTNDTSKENDEKVCRQKNKYQEESAVYPPVYRYNQVKLVSNEESRQLIKEQQDKQDKLLALRAAARLAERLHIKIGNYNPKKVDMAYRQKAVCKDSDDDEDEDEDEADREILGYPD